MNSLFYILHILIHAFYYAYCTMKCVNFFFNFKKFTFFNQCDEIYDKYLYKKTIEFFDAIVYNKCVLIVQAAGVFCNNVI